MSEQAEELSIEQMEESIRRAEAEHRALTQRLDATVQD